MVQERNFIIIFDANKTLIPFLLVLIFLIIIKLHFVGYLELLIYSLQYAHIEPLFSPRYVLVSNKNCDFYSLRPVYLFLSNHDLFQPKASTFLHALSFQCTSKLRINFLNHFTIYFHI